MHDKFRIDFSIDDFSNFSITRLDFLTRNQDLQNKLHFDAPWELIVCDEAHKLSATVLDNKFHYTRRFCLGKLLSNITRHFLLLTATPYNGKTDDFNLFLSLLDSDRFSTANPTKNLHSDTFMRRFTKEELVDFDNKHLFPKRFAYTVNYSLSTLETELYHQVISYVVDGFNKSQCLAWNKRNSVGFSMTILQIRLASSPLAIVRSLEHLIERLK